MLDKNQRAERAKVLQNFLFLCSKYEDVPLGQILAEICSDRHYKEVPKSDDAPKIWFATECMISSTIDKIGEKQLVGD